MVDMFGVVMSLALVVQFVTEILKKLLPEKTHSYAVPLLALVVSIVLAVTTHTGLLDTFGIAVTPPIVDYIITGLLLSGGSVGINELIKSLRGIKETLQSNTSAKV
jgi:hypothetical protein